MVLGQVPSDDTHAPSSGGTFEGLPMDDAIGAAAAGLIFHRSDEWARQQARAGVLPCVIDRIGPSRHTYTFSRSQLERIAALSAPAAGPAETAPARQVPDTAHAVEDEGFEAETMAIRLELAERRIQDLERQLLENEVATQRVRAEESMRALKEANQEVLRLHGVVEAHKRAHAAYVNELMGVGRWDPDSEG